MDPAPLRHVVAAAAAPPAEPSYAALSAREWPRLCMRWWSVASASFTCPTTQVKSRANSRLIVASRACRACAGE